MNEEWIHARECKWLYISALFSSPRMLFFLFTSSFDWPSSAVSSRCSLYKFFRLAKFCCLLKVFFLHVLSTGQVLLSPQGVPFTSSFDWPSSAVSSRRSSHPRAENLKAGLTWKSETLNISNLKPKMFNNLGTLGCTKTYENNALQPSHLTGRSHWDTFPPFFGSCGKRRHRWCCTEPPCQQSMASHASPLPLQQEQVVQVAPHQHQHCHPQLPSFCCPSSCLVPFLRFDQGLSDNMTGLKYTRDPLMDNQSAISWDHPWHSHTSPK